MRLIVPCICVLTLVCVTSLHAELPALEDAVLVTNGSTVLDVGNGAAPTIVDWDNDGIDDLVVALGSSDNGRLRLYTNRGSNMERVFNGYINLKSEGIDIVDPGSGG